MQWLVRFGRWYGPVWSWDKRPPTGHCRGSVPLKGVGSVACWKQILNFYDAFVTDYTSYNYICLYLIWIVTARRHASAIFELWHCQSVCPSERLNLSHCNEHSTIAEGVCSFLTPKILAKLQWDHPNWGSKYTWGRKNCAFRQITR